MSYTPQELAARLSTITDLLPESIVVLDSEGRIVGGSSANGAGEQAAEPTNIAALWKMERPRTEEGASVPIEQHPASRALRGEDVRAHVLAVRRGDPPVRVLLEVTAKPLRDDSGQICGAVLVERDISRHVRMSVELAEQLRASAVLQDRLAAESEKLELLLEERTREVLEMQHARAREKRLASVGRAAAAMLHDVNNTLNPISAAAFLIHTNAERTEEVRKYANQISRAADAGISTASRITGFIRQQPRDASRMSQADLSAAAEEALAILAPVVGARADEKLISVQTELAPDVCIRGDHGEVVDGILNLLHNAIDAIPGAGMITIRTSATSTECLLDVEDTGTGMTEDVRERAFEPFFSTKGAHGSGLGLSEVYGLVCRYSGSIELQSRVNSGTTVRLLFPSALANSGEEDSATDGSLAGDEATAPVSMLENFHPHGGGKLS